MNFYLELLHYLATHPIESFFIVLAQFFAVMWIHNKFHNKWLHGVLALWFIPQDAICNIFLFSIIGMELPREWLVTTRLKRWKQLRSTTFLDYWHHAVAHKVCAILNKADLGHC